jgi:ABC-type nickel/cobalt efflux system permease component RcnA
VSNDHDTLGPVLVKAVSWLAVWAGTVSIADLQPVISVISGALVGVLALINIVKALWPKKDKK